MNLWFRLIWTIIQGFLGRSIDVWDVSKTTFRVWPTDLDLNGHMTNARYLSIMDLGRLDLIVRAGLMSHVLRQKWMPVVSACHLQFKKSLKPFQRYELHSRLIAIDAKWFYIEQRFMVGERMVAYGLVRAVFVSRKEPVPISEVFQVTQTTLVHDPLPDYIHDWDAMIQKVRQEV